MFVPQVNAKVYFGREHGERTLGEVVKVNRTACKVKQLEKRSEYPVGTEWTVPFSLLQPFADAEPAPEAQPSEIEQLRAENARLIAEIERLKAKTAHIRPASNPAMPAVKAPRARRN